MPNNADADRVIALHEALIRWLDQQSDLTPAIIASCMTHEIGRQLAISNAPNFASRAMGARLDQILITLSQQLRAYREGRLRLNN